MNLILDLKTDYCGFQELCLEESLSTEKNIQSQFQSKSLFITIKTKNETQNSKQLS